jgi:hypothetical protein
MLKSELEKLIGREVEVVKTTDGKYIVLFMNFNCPPPPKCDTPEEAIERFAEYWSKHENRIRPPFEDSEDAESAPGT